MSKDFRENQGERESMEKMKAAEFKEKYNVREGTEERNCGTCKSSFTNGMSVPNCKCLHCHDTVGYHYVDEKFTGTVCDLFEENPILKENLIPVSKANIDVSACLLGMTGDEVKETLEKTGVFKFEE